MRCSTTVTANVGRELNQTPTDTEIPPLRHCQYTFLQLYFQADFTSGAAGDSVINAELRFRRVEFCRQSQLRWLTSPDRRRSINALLRAFACSADQMSKRDCQEFFRQARTTTKHGGKKTDKVGRDLVGGASFMAFC